MQLTPLACDDCALMQTMWEHLLDAAGGVPKLTVQVQEFVCQHLAWRGYRKAEAWLHASSSVTATSLLVALAWFIGRCQLFQLYTMAVAGRLDQLMTTMPVPCSAATASWVDAAAAAAERVRNRIARCTASAGNTTGAEVAQRIQQILVEHGRLLHAARELSALQAESVQLKHRIQLWYRQQRQVWVHYVRIKKRRKKEEENCAETRRLSRT